MKAKLLVVGGDVKATEISITLPAVLGRGREANVTLPHPLVSRRHCELFESHGVLMVRDLGSLNGTYVGSQRVIEAPVPSGELLTVATINLRAVYETQMEMNDDTDAPLGLGNDDSTQGRGGLKAAASKKPGDRKQESPTTKQCREPEVPIDRDTEWQVGNVPPKHDDDNDLSSWLNRSQ